MEEFRLETPRMYLREFRLEDANGFYQLNQDPQVIQHTGDKPFADSSAAAAFIQSYDHYKRYGFGRWAIILRQTEEFIGFCGLKYHPDIKAVDLGFRLRRSDWNKGLATEAARTCLEYGFTQLELDLIIGRVRQAHHASIKVLEKIGMQRRGSFDFEGFPGYRYEVSAAEYG
ncbi:MAG: GNAT family N-acetyltransferase [Bacteroidota bacterium]